MEVRQLDETDVADYWRLRLRGSKEEPEAFGSSFEEQAERLLAGVARGFRSEAIVVGVLTFPGGDRRTPS